MTSSLARLDTSNKNLLNTAVGIEVEFKYLECVLEHNEQWDAIMSFTSKNISYWKLWESLLKLYSILPQQGVPKNI